MRSAIRHRIDALATPAVILLAARPLAAQWAVQPSGSEASLRGVSAVSDGVAWATGTRGTVLRTTDGGRSWRRLPAPPASDSLDFRDVHARSATTAWIMSVGDRGQSRIYHTTDGGRRWTMQYTSDRPGFFLDAIAFWDARRGVAMSDPVDGRFVVLTTSDGGAHWRETAANRIPPAVNGEAGFAAGGVALVVGGARDAWFGTGGAAARVFASHDGGESWSAAPTPLASGAPSQGVFALAFPTPTTGVAVGGDYGAPSATASAAAVSADGGRSWTAVSGATVGGYRSGLAVVPGTAGPTLVAVGTSGSDRSTDGGRSWQPIDTVGFNAVSFAPGGAGWAVGDKGRIARWRPDPASGSRPAPPRRR